MLEKGLLFVVVCALLVGFIVPQAVNPVGKWTDSRYPTSGGFLFICKKTTFNTVFTGVYSQIGFVKGKLSSRNIFTGRWYEPGLGREVNGQFLPTSGDVWLNFSAGTSFTGYYTYDDDESSEQYAWTGTQLNTNRPDPIKCWDNTNANPTVRPRGTYRFLSGSLVLAQEAETGSKVQFNASHFHPIPGYFEGWCNDTDQVCRGQFLQEGFYGQALFGIGWDNGRPLLYITVYNGTWEQITMDIGLQFKDSAQHIYTLAPQTSGSAEPDIAAEYQVILLQGNFLNTALVSFNPDESFDYNSSSSYLSAGTTVGFGQLVHSFYREYAVLRGTYDWSSRTLTGEYFAPGLFFSDGSPTFGVYTLSVSWDWLTAVGTFTPSDVLEESSRSNGTHDTVDWAFARSTWFRVNDDESLFNYASPEIIISGRYIGETVETDWKICVDSDNWLNGSISYGAGTNQTLAYTSAYCSSTYQMCSGADTTGDRSNGYTFAFRTDSGVQIDYYQSTSNLPNETVRVTTAHVKLTDVPTSDECWENNYLVLVGTWKDAVYGELLYVNYYSTPSILFGAYSEVGVFRGTYDASAREWTGRWAEAGENYGKPENQPSGLFVISWSDIFSFTSQFRFDNRLTSVPVVALYDHYITSEPAPSVTEAWSNDAIPSISLSGVYGEPSTPNVLYLCLSDASTFPSFTASYNWPNGVKGYVEGVCDIQSDVCRGTFYQNRGSLFGQAIYTLLYEGDIESPYALLSSQFSGEWSEDMVQSQFDNPDLHVVETYPRTSFASSQSDCSSNSALKNITDTSTDDTEINTDSDTENGSWSLMGVNVVVPVVVGLAAVLL